MLHTSAQPRPPAHRERSPFADVPPAHAAHTAVTWLANAGISRGWAELGRSASFQPDAPITREAMAAFLVRYQDVGHHQLD
ncbi:S-layer homology domain-containing protein [uncultured Microbacterium sp.]|uniref:S-layer homology domain-containing protein n=1 Tax=uncultured Microbacterium sp. TaxID=191216 RepID=UPI002621F422|nr:S-layer homology domain-containing protein [uncultured Microbacterium sp.]